MLVMLLLLLAETSAVFVGEGTFETQEDVAGSKAW